ncbi:transposable element Tc1 transposase [Trichonephila clavipes]|nr:transposable element Tc1 transposase [Trichonephila clavipes]
MLGQCLKTAVRWPRHIEPKPKVMFWSVIFYDSRSPFVVIPRTLTENLYVSLVIQIIALSFMNIIHGDVSHQNNIHLHAAVVTQHVRLSDFIDIVILLVIWPARSPNLFRIMYEWGIFRRKLQRHPQPKLNTHILINQVYQTCNSIPQIDIWLLYGIMRDRL